MPRLRVIAAGAVLLSSLLAGVLTSAPPVNAAVTTTVPSRLLDTRNGIGRAAGMVGPGTVVRVSAPSAASSASSLVLNVTATGALGSGYVTAWACDEAKPATSNLNTSSSLSSRLMPRAARFLLKLLLQKENKK